MPWLLSKARQRGTQGHQNDPTLLNREFNKHSKCQLPHYSKKDKNRILKSWKWNFFKSLKARWVSFENVGPCAKTFGNPCPGVNLLEILAKFKMSKFIPDLWGADLNVDLKWALEPQILLQFLASPSPNLSGPHMTAVHWQERSHQDCVLHFQQGIVGVSKPQLQVIAPHG